MWYQRIALKIMFYFKFKLSPENIFALSGELQKVEIENIESNILICVMYRSAWRQRPYLAGCLTVPPSHWLACLALSPLDLARTDWQAEQATHSHFSHYYARWVELFPLYCGQPTGNKSLPLLVASTSNYFSLVQFKSIFINCDVCIWLADGRL